ncbi:MAG: anthranilate phosphoribosyltransferase [Acidiferrobacterales bacterium]
MDDADARAAMRSYLQRIATGPELSKDISFEEARRAMSSILEGQIDSVQAGVFLIALRMKRETDEENRGVLQAILDATETAVAPVDEVMNIADPYDGFRRGLPVSPFLPSVLAACGTPAVSHGLEHVGPKHGITHRKILRAAGVDVDLSPQKAAARVGDPDIGWAYVDQQAFCPKLHALVRLRELIVKRPAITTVEVLAAPVRGRTRTLLMTGYVHKAYPQKYALLARHAGFDSAIIVRGIEGGVIPSLQQPSKLFYYQGEGELQEMPLDPASLGIEEARRAVPIPDGLERSGDAVSAPERADSFAEAAAAAGLDALQREGGPAYDSLVYGAALCLVSLRREESLTSAATLVRKVLASGEPLARFRAS